MEFRCDKCTHVGAAAEVRPSEDGVILVCENCGHENVLETGPSKPEPSESAGREDVAEPDEDAADRGEDAVADSEPPAAEKSQTAAPVKKPAPGRGFSDNDEVRMWLREDALAALIPEPGPGPRCPKCAQRVPPDVENCSRCGLSQTEARKYDEGEAPWQKPPQGKEAEYEQALLLWESLEEDWDEQRLENFVDFVREEDLLDVGIRKVRFYLAEHPDDEVAIKYLRDMAESLQSRLIVAQVAAQASADEFQEDVSRFKTRMVWAALLFWGGIFLLFLAFFWDNCGNGMPQF